MKYSSCKDIFDYLTYISIHSPHYIYLIKRKYKDFDIRRVYINKEELTLIKKTFNGLPSSISQYLWTHSIPFNQIKKRFIKKDIQGIFLDIDKFNLFIDDYIWKNIKS